MGEIAIIHELFIVEGQSAASTIQQSLDKTTQSVFALQGKLINAKKASSSRVLANETCQKLFAALACGIGNDCDPQRLSYSRIILLRDPDADGAHVLALLLILFDQFLGQLIASGYVYAVEPPLYRVSEKNSVENHYLWNQSQLQKLLTNPHRERLEITRLKGIAQFSENECRALLLNSKTRKQISLGTCME